MSEYYVPTIMIYAVIYDLWMLYQTPEQVGENAYSFHEKGTISI